jgi:hypothetical protein
LNPKIYDKNNRFPGDQTTGTAMISPGASLLSGLCVEWCRGSGFGMVAAIFRNNSSAEIDRLSMSWNLTAVKRILKSCCCHSAVMSGGIWQE